MRRPVATGMVVAPPPALGVATTVVSATESTVTSAAVARSQRRVPNVRRITSAVPSSHAAVRTHAEHCDAEQQAGDQRQQDGESNTGLG
jgi:hypothetical protein